MKKINEENIYFPGYKPKLVKEDCENHWKLILPRKPLCIICDKEIDQGFFCMKKSFLTCSEECDKKAIKYFCENKIKLDKPHIHFKVYITVI